MTAWMERAACAETDPDLFFPELDSMWRLDAARKVCANCDVVEACLAYALKNRFEEGVWGGLSPNQRRLLMRKVRQK